MASPDSLNPLQNRRILLGVSGSIACYKAADLASKLTQAGAQVDVVLTEGATRFVTPLVFQSVTDCHQLKWSAGNRLQIVTAWIARLVNW